MKTLATFLLLMLAFVASLDCFTLPAKADTTILAPITFDKKVVNVELDVMADRYPREVYERANLPQTLDDGETQLLIAGTEVEYKIGVRAGAITNVQLFPNNYNGQLYNKDANKKTRFLFIGFHNEDAAKARKENDTLAYGMSADPNEGAWIVRFAVPVDDVKGQSRSHFYKIWLYVPKAEVERLRIAGLIPVGSRAEDKWVPVNLKYYVVDGNDSRLRTVRTVSGVAPEAKPALKAAIASSAQRPPTPPAGNPVSVPEDTAPATAKRIEQQKIKFFLNIDQKLCDECYGYYVKVSDDRATWKKTSETLYRGGTVELWDLPGESEYVMVEFWSRREVQGSDGKMQYHYWISATSDPFRVTAIANQKYAVREGN